MSTSPSIVSEHEAIARTIQMYVDGGRLGQSTQMREAFHPDATIFGYAGDELFAGPIQKLFDWVDQNGPAAELQSRIAAIDVAST
ncbi:MAG: nuclear transport factor 2 family protein, partial [Pyrinomonadaceae bacterium]